MEEQTNVGNAAECFFFTLSLESVSFCVESSQRGINRKGGDVDESHLFRQMWMVENRVRPCLRLLIMKSVRVH